MASGLKQYHLQTAADSGFTTDISNFTIAAAASPLEKLETGLDPGETRFGRIRAEDIAGNFSAWSATVSETTDVLPALEDNGEVLIDNGAALI